MNIALIGHGNVGAPLADPLQRLGHQVTRAAWDAASDAVRKARARLPALEAVAQEQALHVAHMTLLWVRMVRVQGHSPDLAGAALRR